MIPPKIVPVLVALAPSLLCAPSNAATSILGTWVQVDDETHKPQSLIAITEVAGTYQATVVKLFPDSGAPPNPKCTACTGEKKDKPIAGLKVMENVRGDGEVYRGGTITDPDDGTVYRVKLVPSADGRSLAVTGYVGISLFGRTQVWIRK
jgi:uncharacterized protein (DUF2147 family)